MVTLQTFIENNVPDLQPQIEISNFLEQLQKEERYGNATHPSLFQKLEQMLNICLSIDHKKPCDEQKMMDLKVEIERMVAAYKVTFNDLEALKEIFESNLVESLQSDHFPEKLDLLQQILPKVGTKGTDSYVIPTYNILGRYTKCTVS